MKPFLLNHPPYL